VILELELEVELPVKMSLASLLREDDAELRRPV
jgi:hypothetical protein